MRSPGNVARAVRRVVRTNPQNYFLIKVNYWLEL